MKIITSLDALDEFPLHALTIGTFDGVHNGHKELFAKLKAKNTPTSIVTFSSHPLQTLYPQKNLSLITPLPVKLALLEKEGIDLAIVLPFSEEIANLSFDQFLERLPLSSLVLGKEAAFGRGKEGKEANVRSWAETKSIAVEYIEKIKAGKESISSRRIRDAIKMGDLSFAEQLLGRPHILSVPANTTQFSVGGLCMPPDGGYALSQEVLATITTSSKERFIKLNKSFSEPILLSFNSNTTFSLRGIHVI